MHMHSIVFILLELLEVPELLFSQVVDVDHVSITELVFALTLELLVF